MTISFVWTLSYVLILLLVGFAVTSLVVGRGKQRPLAEVIALTIFLGTGVTATLLIWFSMVGVRPTRGLLLPLGLVAAIIVAALARTGGAALPCLPRMKISWAEVAPLPLVIALLAATSIVFIISLGFDFFEWDAFAIWAFKAKVLAAESLHSRPVIFTDPHFSYTHADYPLIVPMLIAGAYGMMNQLHEPLGKVAFPLLYVSQMLLAYTAARRWLGRASSLLLICLFACAPFNLVMAGMGNADSALTAFYLGSLVYLIRWIELRDRRDVILAGLFCVFLANTKSEGMPIAMINACLLFAVVVLTSARARKAWLDLGTFAAIFAFGAGVWWLWRMGVPHTHDDYASRLRFSIIAQNLNRLGIIIPALMRELIDVPRWGILWPMLGFMAVAGINAFADVRAWALWFLLLGQFLLYVLVYVITDWKVNELLIVTQGRLFLHMSPAAMLLIAVHWSACGDTIPPADEQACPEPQ